MRVFLTGASGYIGRAVADALSASGHQVIGLVRNEDAAARLRDPGVHPVIGSLQTPESILDEARASDGVIHTALPHDANAPLVDRGFVEALMTALEGTGSAFVYTSGVWVMGDTAGKTVDETAASNPIPAVAWRAEVEQLVLNAESRGIRGVVIRPAMVYGRGGGVVAPMVESAKTGVVKYIGDGTNHWTFVHVDDLADLYVLALEKAVAGSLLIAAHGPPVRTADLAAAIAEAAGPGVTSGSWPEEEARLVFGPFVEGMLLDQHVSGDRAKNSLGWKPARPSVLDEVREGSYRRR